MADANDDLKIALQRASIDTKTVRDAVKSWASTALGEQFARAQTALRFQRQAPALALELGRKLSNLQSALKGFDWPGESLPAFNGRLVVKDPALDGKIETSLSEGKDAQSYYKYFSRGFDADKETTADAGTYAFTIYATDAEGNTDSEQMSVTVESGWTNEQLVQAVVDAVNDSSLEIQAEAIRQNAPGLEVQGQPVSGLSMALAVNGGLSDKTSLRLQDNTGHLLDHLDMTRANQPVGAPREAAYQIGSARAGQTRGWASSIFDPEETTTIAAGDYQLDWGRGGDSGTIDFTVADGDDWKTVLRHLGNAIDSSTSTAKATLAEVDRPVVVDNKRLTGEGVMLQVDATESKIGERLSLTGATSADQDMLDTLGLGGLSRAGVDASLTVNGRTMVRSPGEFTLDQGRVTLDVTGDVGQSVPLRVADALQVMEDGVADITSAYNDLRTTLLANGPLLRQGVADDFQSPLRDDPSGLSWLGLRTVGEEELAWFDSDSFYSALGQAPDTAKSLLVGDGGLFTSWSDKVDQVLSAGAESLLVNPASLESRLPFLQEREAISELDLERKSQLLDVMEGNTGLDGLPPLPGLVSRKG